MVLSDSARIHHLHWDIITPSQQEAGSEEDALGKQLFFPCKGHCFEAQIHLFLGELADTSQLAFPCALAGPWPAVASLPRMRRRALKSST